MASPCGLWQAGMAQWASALLLEASIRTISFVRAPLTRPPVVAGNAEFQAAAPVDRRDHRVCFGSIALTVCRPRYEDVAARRIESIRPRPDWTLMR